jgi:glycosyltransferase involved in cell wall biosynthesis
MELNKKITEQVDIQKKKSVTQPTVSVVIPTYNRAKYVTETIDSVLSQSYTDYEIIVVNDGSTDNTREALAPYMDRIRYIHQKNSGVSAARNRGIKAARGKWIAFLDSDDIWVPEKLEKQIRVADCTDVIYFHRAKWFVDNENDTVLLAKCTGVCWPATDSKGMVLDPILSVARAEPYMTPALLCHRSCFDRVGFFEEMLTAGEDEDWLSRASVRCKFHYLSETLVNVRYHQDQTGLDREASVRSLIIVFERMFKRVRAVHPAAGRVVRKRLANKLSHLANILSEHGKRLDAAKYAWKSYWIEPQRVQRLVKICLILAGWKHQQEHIVSEEKQTVGIPLGR